MDTTDKTEKIFKALRLFFLSIALVVVFAGGIAENYSLTNTFSTISAYADAKQGQIVIDGKKKNADGTYAKDSNGNFVLANSETGQEGGYQPSSNANGTIETESKQADYEVFNTVVTLFKNASDRYEIVFGYAQTMLLTLITLDFALSVIMGLLDDGTNYVALMIKKTLKYGFWIWIVANWVNGENFCNLILQSFATVGGAVGGIDNPMDQLINPSWYVTQGYSQFSNFLALGTKNVTIGNFVTGIINWIYCFFAGLAILISFFIIAFQLTIAMVEFYLSSTLSLIMLPLGVFEHTAQWGRAPFSLVIGHGAKVMVIGAVAGIIRNFVEGETLKTLMSSTVSASGTFLNVSFAITLAGICIVFAMLALNLPAIASGLVSGSPSLSAGAARSAPGAVASGISAAAGGAMGALGGMAMMKGAAQGGAMLAQSKGESGAMGALKGLARAAAAPVASELGAKAGEGRSKGSTENPSNWYGPYNYHGNEYSKDNTDKKSHPGEY